MLVLLQGGFLPHDLQGWTAIVATYLIGAASVLGVVWRTVTRPINERIAQVKGEIAREKDDRQAADAARDAEMQRVADMVQAYLGRMELLKEMVLKHHSDGTEVHHALSERLTRLEERAKMERREP